MTRKRYDNKDEYLGPAVFGFDVTPSGTEFDEPTRLIMVSADGVTVAGKLDGQDVVTTTFALKGGVVYPLSFKSITAVVGGTVKGYY